MEYVKDENMCYAFSDCNSLEILPDISKWDTSNVIKMNYLFKNCSSLKSLPDISKWNISNVKEMKDIFEGCPKFLVTSKNSVNFQEKECFLF